MDVEALRERAVEDVSAIYHAGGDEAVARTMAEDLRTLCLIGIEANRERPITVSVSSFGGDVEPATSVRVAEDVARRIIDEAGSKPRYPAEGFDPPSFRLRPTDDGVEIRRVGTTMTFSYDEVEELIAMLVLVLNERKATEPEEG